MHLMAHHPRQIWRRNGYDHAVGNRSRLGGCLIVFVSLLIAGCGSGGGSAAAIPPFQLFSAVVVADMNGDGLSDIVTCYSYIAGPPPHPGYVAVYLQDPARPGHFLPANVYSVGNDPVSVAVGDLDGDGKADIVTANAILSSNGAGASTVSVLLQSSARPGLFLPAASYATGVNPVSVAIGDLNNDGRPDLAVADSAGVSILFQNPAAPGTFQPEMPIGIGGAASSVAIVDLNGDGKPDLVVTNAKSLLVLLQDPTTAGSFSVPTSYSAGAQPIFASVGDLDGDGRPDVAVANLGSPSDPSTASVSVLLQDPGAPGSLLNAVTYATDSRSGAVAIADLNGDGRADLAVANFGTISGPCPPSCRGSGTSVSVLLQDPTVPGRLLSATNYPAAGGDFTAWVAIADMNGDGTPDLIIAQAGGIFVRFQDPSHPGQFIAATPVPN
jgi:hypothetical protein